MILSLSRVSVDAGSTDYALFDQLGEDQTNWIEEQSDDLVTVAIKSDSMMLFYDSEGNVKGYIYDFFNELSRQTGLKFELVVGDWDYVTQDIIDNKVDLIIGNYVDEDSTINGYFSKSINHKPYWICSEKNYQSIFDLTDNRVGFLSKTNAYESFKSTYELEMDPVLFETKEKMFQSLQEGDIDAIMVSDCVNVNDYLNGYNIKRNFMVRDILLEIRAIGKDEKLIDIIDTFIENNGAYIEDRVTQSTNSYIRNYIELSNEELVYLDGLEKIKVGYMINFLPFDYAAGDEMKGISSELVKDIALILDKKVEFTAYKSMAVMETALKEGTIDMITSYGSYHDNIETDFAFSTSYSSSSIAVLGHITNRLLPHKLHDLNNSRIALIKGGWQETMLVTNQIEYTPIYIDNVHEMMQAVNNNEADYAIENQWTLSYLLNELSYENIRPSGGIDIKDSRHFIYKNEDTMLRDISNRIISAVNLTSYENEGLYENYQIQKDYEFYEVLTVTLFLFLCFIGIYIAFLINRLNVEKQKAEAANKSKSEFLAKMSHEIRTPLTAIMGYINLLSKSDNINGKEKQQLKIAHNSSSILIHLVNDILDFSKIEAGKVKIVEQDFNLRWMINNTINMMGVMAEEKNLDFIVKLHQDLPEYIRGDERRVEQILINILSNSVKFTKEGIVELSIVPEYFEDRVRLNFTVKDSGKGMKAETINMIFDAFEQEDNSISRRYGGTGLGLYISKDFIERMGGEIKVKSDVGQGTEFSFYTIHKVVKGVEAISEKAMDRTMNELKGMKVLLVEDNDINQMIIRDILVEMGLKVIITNNGKEALEVVNPQIDFVLMDIQMPVMNGMIAIKEMKKRKDLTSVPIIALTANVMPEQIESYYKEGFDAYCSKPIMINELAQTLLQMYEKYHLKDE